MEILLSVAPVMAAVKLLLAETELLVLAAVAAAILLVRPEVKAATAATMVQAAGAGLHLITGTPQGQAVPARAAYSHSASVSRR